ncbi:hypothetical protein [Paenisporosarcina quisquiliarum]|uniref:hypothetical protein n=1 Tax=Paenisporosarcina quisquiliarum TaxID=365346 RepID=UPI0037356633
MRKFSFSILGGIIIGLILSFVLMDYEVIKYEIRDQAGIESRWVSEMDFNFVFNASMLVFGVVILIFIVWSFVERKIAD